MSANLQRPTGEVTGQPPRGCWVLGACSFHRSPTGRICVLRMESSPLAPSAFHDTCCIIALSLSITRTYPLHEYQTNEAIPIFCYPEQSVASTATAHAHR